MLPPSLELLEKRLRRATECRRHAEVARLATEFAEGVRKYAQTLPRGDPHRAGAARKVLEVLSWTLLMTQAARATCLADLRRVATANRYARRTSEPARALGVRIDA